MKIGDKVVRINCANGNGAKVGQEATVDSFGTGRFKNMIYVTYPGCKKDKDGAEGWHIGNVRVLPPVPTPLETLIAARATRERKTEDFLAASAAYEKAAALEQRAINDFNAWVQEQVKAKASEVKS